MFGKEAKKKSLTVEKIDTMHAKYRKVTDTVKSTVVELMIMCSLRFIVWYLKGRNFHGKKISRIS